MKLENDELEMLHFFCFRLLHDFKTGKYNTPNFKFVFSKEDSKIIIDYLESLKAEGHAIQINIKTHISNRNIMVSEIEETINIIKEIDEEYREGGDENNLYIEVPDYKKFFKLLSELLVIYEENTHLVNFSSLIRSLWLRMGPSDMANILEFLNRQIEFTKNDYKLPTRPTLFKTVDNLEICYFNNGNQEWFETNSHVRPLIRRAVGEYYNSHYEETTKNYESYYLPTIHCGFTKEGDNPTCYVYGIQQLGNCEQDPVIKNITQEERKRLRNKYVSPDFIIALKIFIDILKEKGITTIKVPLLQVYNYEYHQSVGNKYYEKLKSYSPERIHDLEWMNASDCAIEDYQNTKKQVERFYGKEDIISANKTERLIYTFYLLAEKYDNIEILTEPFVESDNLICKIKYEKENKQHL